MGGGRTSLYERQWNEVDAIKSIYIDEFEEIAFPWKKVDHPPCFVLHLSCADMGNASAVDVEFKLTPNYPETPPEMRVTKKKGIQASQTARIHEQLVEKAKTLVGSEMIFELAELAKELLAAVCEKKVSFHDEMVQRKLVSDAKPVARSPESFDSQEAIELAERIRDELGSKERLIRGAKERRGTEEVSNVLATRELHFDPPISVQLPDTETPLRIPTVRLGEALLEADFGDCTYEASAVEGVDLLVTVARFEGAFYHTAHGRKKLHATCKKIQDLADIRYSPLYCRVLGATIVEVGERASDLWVATEARTGIILGRLLECSGSFSLRKAMAYLETMLNALSILHSSNVAHQDLTLSNVAIATTMTGLQIINPGVTRLLRDLHQTHPISPRFEAPEEVHWRPPEIVSRGGQVGKKADIWNAGHVFLQMCFGAGWTSGFEGPADALAGCRLPQAVGGLLGEMMQPEAASRPTAMELLNHVAFSPKALAECDSFAFGGASASAPQYRSYLSFMDTPRRPERRDASRYKTDFEEIQFLGRGAFGEVIKVRNRIDNRFYAIKRIKLDPLNVEDNKKILREVMTLSRLHHDRVVRYYQAWIEGGQHVEGGSVDAGGNGGSTKDDGEGDATDEYTSDEYTSDESDEEWTREGVSSRKMYASNVVGSTTSLSSIVQFHTGFTSDEGSLVGGSENVLKSGGGPQHLYIQMEYCPNQTLRDVIDAGIDRDECWRLFRQIIEGLCHVHAQGMIHRDLKPGNIFLDTNGDVKIGDFGLAVGDDGDRVGRASPAAAARDEANESLTGGVGTPMYVSPEQEASGSRYNQKVDMYSLGVILLELLVPFATGMERAMVIKDARSAAVRLPAVLERPDMGKAAAVLRNLLGHDPRSRFSSEELLRSDLLPPKVEDEYIGEAIRTVSSPNTPYFAKLLGSIFAQAPDPLRDYVFDYHAGLTGDLAQLTALDEIGASLVAVMRRHGAMAFAPPLLLPNGLHVDDVRVTLLARSGQIVHLPTGLTRPFARFVAQNGVRDMRRYTIGSVFRDNLAGGQPRQPLEASFDIVHSEGADDRLLPELEAMRVAGEVLNHVTGVSLSLLVRLNHLEVLSAVLTQCQIPPAKRRLVMGILAQYHSSNWNKVKGVLSSQVVLPASCIDAVGKLAGIRDLEPQVAVKRLEEMLRSSRDCHDALRHVSLLVAMLPAIGLKLRVCVDPLFNTHDGIYSGTVFQLGLDERKRSEALAAGGCYKQLIDGYRVPTDRDRGVSAVGVTWQLARLHHLCTTFGARVSSETRVLIYSTGPDMLSEKLAIAAMLWDAGLMVEVVREDVVTSEHISQMARSRAISLAIQLKDHASRGQFGVVRLRNFERRQEADVTRPELVEALHDMVQEGGRRDAGSRADADSVQGGAQPTFAPLNVTLFAPYAKVKGNQKSLIMEKAVRAMAPVLASLSGPRPIEIIAHDLSLELTRKIIDRLADNDELFKKCVDSRDEREAAIKMRTLLRGLRDKKSFAFLYNYREGWIKLASLLNEP